MDGLQFDFNAGTAAAGDRFLITPFSNAAANINLNSAIKSPEQLAMAQKVLPDTSGTAALHGTLDSGNAEAMLALRDLIMFDGSSLTDGFSSAMSEIGARVQNATSTAAVSKSLAISIENDRTSVSGVNLDEEAAKLLQYQQSYQASAKMLQIAQGIFDTLLQTVSR
ncbi:MAG: flagellar hook-associated protein FlgK [Rhodoferax sp.]|jgi:flagellar hook-associated protein FlgK